jgi:hypothetical protein
MCLHLCVVACHRLTLSWTHVADSKSDPKPCCKVWSAYSDGRNGIISFWNKTDMAAVVSGFGVRTSDIRGTNACPVCLQSLDMHKKQDVVSETSGIGLIPSPCSLQDGQDIPQTKNVGANEPLLIIPLWESRKKVLNCMRIALSKASIMQDLKFSWRWPLSVLKSGPQRRVVRWNSTDLSEE